MSCEPLIHECTTKGVVLHTSPPHQNRAFGFGSPSQRVGGAANLYKWVACTYIDIL